MLLITVLGGPASVFCYWDLGASYHILRTSVLGPYPCTVPPPDGKWYTAGNQQYGITRTEFQTDFMDKDFSKSRWKPVLHGKAEGTLISKCPYGSPCPYFGPVGYTRVLTPGGSISPFVSFRGNHNHMICRDLEMTRDKIMRRTDIVVTALGPEMANAHYIDVPESALQGFNNECPGYRLEYDNTVAISSGCITKENITELHGKSTDPRQSSFTESDQFSSLGRTISRSYIFNMLAIRNTDGFVEVQYEFSYAGVLNDDTTNWVDVVQASGSYDGICQQITAGGAPIVPRPHTPSVKSLYLSMESSLDIKDKRRAMKKVRTKALCDATTLDMNNLENIMGLPGTLNIVKTLIEGYKAFKNFNLVGALKAITDLYLIVKFAIIPAVSDVKKVRKDGANVMLQLMNEDARENRRRHSEAISSLHSDLANFSSVSFSTTYWLERNTGVEERLIASIEQIGLLPTPKNLWDLVPFSFVVDWFTGIGDTLEAYRLTMDQWLYTLLRRIESQKYQFEWTQHAVDIWIGPEFTPESTIKGTLYRRSCYRSWGSTDPLLLAGFSGLSGSQWFTGGALAIQRALN